MKNVKTESILIINSNKYSANKSLKSCKRKYDNYGIYSIDGLFSINLIYYKISCNINKNIYLNCNVAY